jgi:hypothetical protein
LLQAEAQSCFSLLFALDLRANALRLSRGKTGAHFSGSCASRAKADSRDPTEWSKRRIGAWCP